MKNELLSIELQEYLKHCGLSKKKIAQCTPDTRMYHDLDIYGDIAEAYIEVLIDKYHVDMTGFDFYTFFPPETFATNIFTGIYHSMVPFVNTRARKQGIYQPLTLAMIENLLYTKIWR